MSQSQPKIVFNCRELTKGEKSLVGNFKIDIKYPALKHHLEHLRHEYAYDAAMNPEKCLLNQGKILALQRIESDIESFWIQNEKQRDLMKESV